MNEQHEQKKLKSQIKSITVPTEREFSRFVSLTTLTESLNVLARELSSLNKSVENCNSPDLKKDFEEKQTLLDKRFERVNLLSNWTKSKIDYLNKIKIPKSVTNELFSGEKLPDIQKEEAELVRIKERLGKLVLPITENESVNSLITRKQEQITTLYQKIEDHKKRFDDLTQEIKTTAELPENIQNINEYIDVQNGEFAIRARLETLARIKNDLKTQKLCSDAKKALREQIKEAEKSLRASLVHAYNQEIKKLEPFKLPEGEFTTEGFNQALDHYLEDLKNKRIQLEVLGNEWNKLLSKRSKREITEALAHIEQRSTEAKIFASALKVSIKDLTDILNTVQSEERAVLNAEILDCTIKFINTSRDTNATPEQKKEAADEYQAMIDRIPTIPEEVLDKGSREKLISTLCGIFGAVALAVALLAGIALVAMAIAAAPAVAIGAGVAGVIAGIASAVTTLGISTTALAVTAAASAVTGVVLLSVSGFFGAKSSDKAQAARAIEQEYEQYGKVKEKCEHIKEVIAPTPNM